MAPARPRRCSKFEEPFRTRSSVPIPEANHAALFLFNTFPSTTSGGQPLVSPGGRFLMSPDKYRPDFRLSSVAGDLFPSNLLPSAANPLICVPVVGEFESSSIDTPRSRILSVERGRTWT